MKSAVVAGKFDETGSETIRFIRDCIMIPLCGTRLFSDERSDAEKGGFINVAKADRECESQQARFACLAAGK